MAVLFRRDTPPRQKLDLTVGAAVAGRAQSGSPVRALSIEQIIQQRLVTAEFQPMVRLSTREVIGYEALARGPADSQFPTPGSMFQAAGGFGMVGELDVVAHAAAYWAALNGQRVLSLPLFVNANPAGLMTPVPEDLQETVSAALERLHVFMEVSERSLVADPIGSLVAIEYARRGGWRMALDNVGSSAAGLPLIPFAQPDVIKMDMSLVAREADADAIRVVHALAAHVELTGAVLAAQGIETDKQRDEAIGMGAALGQGYSFGRPLTLPVAADSQEPLDIPQLYEKPDATMSPFETLKRSGRTPTRSAGSTLRALGLHLDSVVAAEGDPVVVVMCDGLGISGSAYGELRSLVRRSSLAVMLTHGPAARAVPKLHTLALADDDPLQGEMIMAVVGANSAALLTFRRPEGETEGWEYYLTYDRAMVIRASRGMLQRAIETELALGRTTEA